MSNKLFSSDDFSQLIDSYYAERKGYIEFSAQEVENLLEDDIYVVYGEILPEGVFDIINTIKPDYSDKFVDLGSGTGKVALQIFLCTASSVSIGVEANVERWMHGCEVKRLLQNDKPEIFSGKKELIYLRENLLNFDFNQATIIFMNAICFSEQLMQFIAGKINDNPIARCVISSKKVPGLTNLISRRTLPVATSWHQLPNKSDFYVYTKTCN